MSGTAVVAFAGSRRRSKSLAWLTRRLMRAVAARCLDRLRCWPSAIWVAWEAAHGRVSTYRELKVLYKLRRFGANGYYHNVKLSSRYSTQSVGGERRNRPLTDPNFESVLWKSIETSLGHELRGRRVVDIGPAEGYFALEAAKAGAAVTVIHPPHDFVRRLEALAEYFGLGDRIAVIRGYYPAVGADAVRSADVVLCLGLLYHLENLVDGLEPMIRSQATTLVIEGMFFADGTQLGDNGYAQGFDPVDHKNNMLVCARWLQEYLLRKDFAVVWRDEWQQFVERPGNLRQRFGVQPGQLRQAATRKLLVATRRGYGGGV